MIILADYFHISILSYLDILSRHNDRGGSILLSLTIVPIVASTFNADPVPLIRRSNHLLRLNVRRNWQLVAFASLLHDTIHVSDLKMVTCRRLVVVLCIHTSCSQDYIFVHLEAIGQIHEKICLIRLFATKMTVGRVHFTILAIVDHALAVGRTRVSEEVTAVASLISCTVVA